MNRIYEKLSDWTEYALSKWWGFVIYCLFIVGCFYIGGWDAVDKYVYVTSAVMLVLLLNAGRRDSLATHSKLDDLVPEKDQGLEKKPEAEILESCNNT